MGSSPRNVLITGGAAGIGLALARAFHDLGDTIAIGDIDEESLTTATAELDAFGQLCDMGNRSHVSAFVEAAASALGGLDVVISNAGISGPTAPVDLYDPDQWDRVLATNLTGCFLLARASTPYLRQSVGSMIVISSVAGRFGYPERSAYSASKWGLVGLTKTLAMELGAAGIRVNAILPGAVSGPRLDRVFEGRAESSGRTVDEIRTDSMANQSIQQLVTPEQVAALAIFLASDAAQTISGQAIAMDGDKQSAL